MSKLENILWNVLGGILAGLALIGLERLYRYLRAWKFRSFFGVDESYFIIYTLYNAPTCPKNDSECKLLFGKTSRKNAGSKVGSGINLHQVASIASTKGVGYLVEAFSRNMRKAPNIAADVDTNVMVKMNISFVAVGGKTNYKSSDLLNNPSNVFLHFEGNKIICPVSKEIIAKLEGAKPGDDIGLIVKIHPDANPERTWICCAGFGITGTVGTTYYLSRKWRKLKKYAGRGQFGCVLSCPSISEEDTKLMRIVMQRKNPKLDWIRSWRARRDGIEVTLV